VVDIYFVRREPNVHPFPPDRRGDKRPGLYL